MACGSPSGAISLGDVQAFIQYSRQFTQPLTQVASMANLLQSGVASAERVFDLLDADEQTPDPAEPFDGDRPARPGRVRQRVVPYKPRTPLIEDLSLVAEPGQTVAIVGPTGAGKTTLVNLIMRFYELDAGRITLDGVDITTMTRDDLRASIGMVLQDTWLFERHDPGEHRLRTTRRDRGGDPRSGEGNLRRPVRRTAAPTGTTPCIDDEGRQRQRRRAAADHDRPGVPGRPVTAHPGRGDEFGRHPDRGAGAAGDGSTAVRTGPAS